MELFSERGVLGKEGLWNQTQSSLLDIKFLMTSKHSMKVLSELLNKHVRRLKEIIAEGILLRISA